MSEKKEYEFNILPNCPACGRRMVRLSGTDPFCPEHILQDFQLIGSHSETNDRKENNGAS